VKDTVLLRKTGLETGCYNVLISQRDTDLCNENNGCATKPVEKPVQNRKDKEHRHRMMHWSFCRINNCPAHYDMPTHGKQMSADAYYGSDGEPVWDEKPRGPQHDLKLPEEDQRVRANNFVHVQDGKVNSSTARGP